MKRTIITLIALLAAGCSGPFPGFRFAPSEPEKRSAQTADDLAKGLQHTGAQPGSPAATTLAKSTGPARLHAGEPKNPVDVAPLIKAEAGAWETKQAQADAWKLKEGLYARASRITAEALSDLARTIQTEGKVAASEIIHRTTAICDFNKMAAEFTRRIPVPADKKLSEIEQAHLDALVAIADQNEAIARALAARRPTGKEVSEKLREEILATKGEAEEWIGLAKEVVPWVLGALGVGGVGYAVKKRKSTHQAEQERDQARHDEANARHAAEMVKAEAVVNTAKAMELLAAAQPPKSE